MTLAFLPAFGPTSTADAKSPPRVAAAGEKEAPMSMDQVPATVKSAAEKAAKGGTLGAVTKETEKGKTFYEVEIQKNGKNRYVHISEDGKILKRESARKEAKTEMKDEKKSTTK